MKSMLTLENGYVPPYIHEAIPRSKALLGQLRFQQSDMAVEDCRSTDLPQQRCGSTVTQDFDTTAKQGVGFELEKNSENHHFSATMAQRNS